MEIGKYYYVLTYKGRLFEDIITIYAGNEPYEHSLMTTTNIKRTQLYESYEKALEHAKKYDLKVKKIRVDILGLGSK
ncbi:hypothetical protein AALK46_07485 [Staphylococcus nepalensis]|uniref:hypothetical protein n=1 Tax=Staphylococcus nepalensis TaxID=214473 RepID=UPI003514E08C